MEIPLLNLQAQYKTIKNDVDEAMLKVVANQYFVLSPEVTSFEQEISEYCGVLYGAGVASGTDALILALRAAGIGKGDLVITTPFTFFATAEAVSFLGGRPLFVDIDSETYNIDPDKIEELLQDVSIEERQAIKAILPVHLYGQSADMERILSIADKYDLKVIEDCAQAIGTVYNGKMAGSFGIAGCLSFFPSKNLGGFGDGGMVISSDEALITRIKKLRVHGSREQYIHEEIGYNSRLDSLQAAILRVKLRKLETWINARGKIAEKYNRAFSPLGINIPKVSDNGRHTYHQYTISVKDRDKLLGHLNDQGIAARVYYPVPLHLQPCYKYLDHSIGSFPVSEKAAEEVLSLPIYPELTDEQVDYIIQRVKDLF
ncbi:MAG: DegT/DnrJ/EryC1/StrS family aminotransferase [Candidatus Omnitrophota bacterium]